jgi:hypothetical protein
VAEVAHTRLDGVVCTRKRFTFAAGGGVRRAAGVIGAAVLLLALGECAAAAWSLASTAGLSGTQSVSGAWSGQGPKSLPIRAWTEGNQTKPLVRDRRTRTQTQQCLLATIAYTFGVCRQNELLFRALAAKCPLPRTRRVGAPRLQGRGIGATLGLAEKVSVF